MMISYTGNTPGNRRKSVTSDTISIDHLTGGEDHAPRGPTPRPYMKEAAN
jgi:hypothetical protein